MLLSAILALTTLGATADAAAPGDPENPKPIDVSVSKDKGDPRYGDVFEFSVKLSGISEAASVAVTDHVTGATLASATTSSTATFQIPTLGKYAAAVTHQLDIDVVSDMRFGSSLVRFTPTKITGTIVAANTSVAYHAPVFAMFTPDKPTPVRPTGKVKFQMTKGIPTEADIRTDGTVSALTQGQIGPDEYTITYKGDDNFAAASWTGRITIRPMPTNVETLISTDRITQGDQLSLQARVVTPDTTVQEVPSGNMYVEAQRAGTSTWETITDPRPTFSSDFLTFDLTEAFATRPGAWTLRARYAGTTGADPSEKPLPLQVDPSPPVKAGTTTTTSLSTSSGVVGSPVTVTVTVTGDDGVVPTGKALVTVGGSSSRVDLNSQGIGTWTTTLAAAGPLAVRATYEGSAAHLESTSQQVTVTSLRASTAVSASMPGPVRSGTLVPVRVASTNSSVVPTGPFTVLENDKEIGRGTAPRDSFAVPELTPGRHAVIVRYLGDDLTDASEVEVTLDVENSTNPGKAGSTISLALDRDTAAVGGVVVIASAKVSVAGGATPDGQVSVVVDGTVLASKPVGTAAATFVLPVDKAGSHRVQVRYAGSSTQAPSESAVVTYTVTAAPAVASAIKASFKKAKNGKKVAPRKKPRLTVTATVTSARAVSGKVKVLQTVKVRKPGKKGKKPTTITKQKVVGTATITKSGTTARIVVTTKPLTKGRQTLTVRYLGSPTVRASTRTYKVRVR